MYLFNCITEFGSDNPRRVNVITSPKNPWNLQKGIFILLFLHSEPNWVTKSYFKSDLRFWDCLITRWLETTSILVVIEGIYRYQFKSNHSKNHRPFAALFLHFWYLSAISNVLKKKMNFRAQVFLKLLTTKDVPI